jgi:hypothetical protein
MRDNPLSAFNNTPFGNPEEADVQIVHISG